MQIAVDGLLLTGNFTGVAKVILGQMAALLNHKFSFDIDFIFIVPQDTDIYSLLGRRDFKVIYAPFNGCQKFKRVVWQQFKMGKLLNEMGVEILYSPGYISSYSFKSIKVTYIHDTIALSHPNLCTAHNAFSYQILLRMTALISDFIAVPSESSKKDVRRYLHARQDKIGVVPLAPTTPDLKYRPRSESRYIIAVSAIEPKKNFANLIRWYNYWREEGGIDHKLYIVGNLAWKYDSVIYQYNNSKYKNDIMMLGYQPSLEVAKLISGADLLVMPSIYEGFGLPVLEAMKSETPVVSSDQGSLPELVEGAGIALPLKDSIWQVAIPVLLSDKRRLKQMSRDGLKKVQNYTWERIADDLYDIFAYAYKKKHVKKDKNHL